MLVRNPETGLLEEDGAGEPDTMGALPKPDGLDPELPEQTVFAGGGTASNGTSAPPPGTPPPAAPPASLTPGVPAASIFPAKPTYESKDTEKTRIKTAGDVAAEKAVADAEGATDAAQAKVGELNVKEAEAVKKGASDRVKADEARIKAHDDAEKARAELVAKNTADDDKEIEEVKAAKIKAGGAREHYYDNRTGAKIFHAILTGIAQGVQTYQGKSGPTPVDVILEEKYSALEKDLMGQYTALKESHDDKGKQRAASLAEEDRARVALNNRALLSVDLIENQVKEAIAALSPDKQKAANDLLQKSTAEARAKYKQQRQDAYARIHEHETVNRSETSSGGASKQQLSNDTVEAAAAATEYKRLGAEQLALLQKHGGSVPLPGTEDGTTWDANERAMARAKQKSLGKSDNDAKLAEEAQGSPGTAKRLFSHVPGVGQITVDNYKANLAANERQAEEYAKARINIENKPAGAAATAVLDKGEKAAPAPAKKEGVQGWTDAEVRGGYQNALAAKNAKATTALLQEMKRRGIKPSGK
jgi:hypothetical protein